MFGVHCDDVARRELYLVFNKIYGVLQKDVLVHTRIMVCTIMTLFPYGELIFILCPRWSNWKLRGITSI